MIEEQKITAFIEFGDDEFGLGFTESDIARTRDTVSNFIDACREIARREQATMPDGTVVTVLYRTQRFKGEPRKDLVIADFGDARAVVFF